MKKLLLIFLLSIFLFSCKESANNDSEETSDNTEQVSDNDADNDDADSDEDIDLVEIAIDPITPDINDDFYLVSISAAETQDEAIEAVTELRKTYENANYLWIPDYASLSGKELYVVFLGPYDYLDDDAFRVLSDYKKINSNVYFVKASQEETRITLLSKFDYRVNSVRQKLIIAYAEESELDEYYEDGGEDWGWFNYDVDTYFLENHPDDVTFIYGLPDWITAEDMNAYAKKMDNKNLNFGYYLIDGDNEMFIQHDVSDYVMEQACDFFGYDFEY